MLNTSKNIILILKKKKNIKSMKMAHGFKLKVGLWHFT